MDDDARLAAALADDLDGAFERLVTAHQDRLFSIALRMLGDRGAAEEAAQDAFVRAYRALAGYGAERVREVALRPWLATIVLNLCRSRLTRRAKVLAAEHSLDARLADGIDMATSPAAGPAAVAETRAARTAWAARVLALPLAYRGPVVLRHVDGLSYPDLAAALGRPEGTVKAQVHRGTALLRAMLEAERRREPTEMSA
ncbi:MAG: RNA polymerase sigma factor [Candidatus Limnocylindria bacterium]